MLHMMRFACNQSAHHFMLLSPSQFVQHTAGTQEGTHPQVCSGELLFLDEKGKLFMCGFVLFCCLQLV